MDNSPALFRPTPPFPPPSSASSRDWTPLEYVVSFLALVTIPTLIYMFFFILKCPPISFWRRHRRSDAFPAELSSGGGGGNTDNAEVISDMKYYRKDTHVIDIGSECPVCLSAFNDGEEVRQLMSCKHSFHASCIDLWLHSHSNCPICRASVPLKPSKVLIPSQEEDRRAASPDSARLP